MKATFDTFATGIQDFSAEERIAQSVLVPTGWDNPAMARSFVEPRLAVKDKSYVFGIDISAHRRQITLQIQRHVLAGWKTIRTRTLD